MLIQGIWIWEYRTPRDRYLRSKGGYYSVLDDLSCSYNLPYEKQDQQPAEGLEQAIDYEISLWYKMLNVLVIA